MARRKKNELNECTVLPLGRSFCICTGCCYIPQSSRQYNRDQDWPCSFHPRSEACSLENRNITWQLRSCPKGPSFQTDTLFHVNKPGESASVAETVYGSMDLELKIECLLAKTRANLPTSEFKTCRLTRILGRFLSGSDWNPEWRSGGMLLDVAVKVWMVIGHIHLFTDSLEQQWFPSHPLSWNNADSATPRPREEAESVSEHTCVSCCDGYEVGCARALGVGAQSPCRAPFRVRTLIRNAAGFSYLLLCSEIGVYLYAYFLCPFWGQQWVQTISLVPVSV